MSLFRSTYLAALLGVLSAPVWATQLVVLDFDTGTDDVVSYSQSMRDDIQTRMEAHYADFDVTFTQNLNPMGPASRIVFNSGVPGGLAEGIDFRNLNQDDDAVVNVGGILPGASESDVISASAVIGSHELGHLLGLRHADSMGPIGLGLPSTGRPAASRYSPNYPGPANAAETVWHIMASPASVGSSLNDLLTPSWLSERSAIKLALIDQGVTANEGMGMNALQFDEPMVPNTLQDGINVGQAFDVKTATVVGQISAAGQADEYSFAGEAGEVFTFELMSGVFGARTPMDINSFLRVLDSSDQEVLYYGTPAFNDNEFETSDSHLIDLVLPADDTYRVVVGSVNAFETGDYELFVNRFQTRDPNSENLPPTAMPQMVSTAAGAPLEITLTGNDPEGEAITFRITEQPQDGSLTGMPPGVTYEPDMGFSGSDSFMFVANDGELDSLPATISIDVVAENERPVANSQDLSVDEDGSLMITLTGSDADDDELTFQIVDGPDSGQIQGDAPSLTYQPDADFFGSDLIVFNVSDQQSTSENAEIRIEVLPVNDLPVAQSRMLSVAQGGTLDIQLVATDVDEDPLSFQITGGPDSGELTGMPPSVVYQSDPDFIGEDEFRFVASDGTGASDEATIVISVGSDRSELACGRPENLDRRVDRGSFLWSDCAENPQWFFQVNGGGVSTNQTSSGSFEVLGGVQALQLVSIESIDTVDTTTDPNALWFDLKVKRTGVDRLEFMAAEGACFLPGSSSSNGVVLAEPVFLGVNRVPLEAPSFSLDTGLECQEVQDSDGDGLTDDEERDIGTNPLVPDTDGGGIDDGVEVANGTNPLDPADDVPAVDISCFAPTVDSATEAGLFLWRACDGSNQWSMLASGGGGGRAVYSGLFEGGAPLAFESVSLNGNDTAEITEDGFNYRLIVRNAGRDLFRFTPAAGTCVRTLAPNQPVFLGETKTPAQDAGVNLDAPELLCQATPE